MDELDRFRGFRRGVLEPSGDATRRASALLAGAIDAELTPGLGLRRPKLRFVAIVAAALAGATAAALFVSAPWQESTGFLERAQAALNPPGETIRHERWTVTKVSSNPSCRITGGPNEIWVDQRPPYRYRAVVFDRPSDTTNYDPRKEVCSRGKATELGGTPGKQALMFVPPNSLRRAGRFAHPWDPVTELRDALDLGRAHDEGTTQLDGRTVQRIRLEFLCDSQSPGCEHEPSYAYVDPETFYPVQIESPSGLIVGPDGSRVRFRFVMRILSFEYLPRTAANVALTDIRAQHPTATGP
jgi:hypothetical protein